jgi:hypothetical protein
MNRSRACAGVLLASWLAAGGCSTLREIPRAEYGQLAERKGVRVETRDGLVYDFDYVTVGADSLTGFRHRSDVEGPVDQTVSFVIALEEIQVVTARRLDWYRTGLVGGGVLAGVLVAGLAGTARNGESGGSSGGGKGGGTN